MSNFFKAQHPLTIIAFSLIMGMLLAKLITSIILTALYPPYYQTVWVNADGDITKVVQPSGETVYDHDWNSFTDIEVKLDQVNAYMAHPVYSFVTDVEVDGGDLASFTHLTWQSNSWDSTVRIVNSLNTSTDGNVLRNFATLDDALNVMVQNELQDMADRETLGTPVITLTGERTVTTNPVAAQDYADYLAWAERHQSASGVDTTLYDTSKFATSTVSFGFDCIEYGVESEFDTRGLVQWLHALTGTEDLWASGTGLDLNVETMPIVGYTEQPCAVQWSDLKESEPSFNS